MQWDLLEANNWSFQGVIIDHSQNIVFRRREEQKSRFPRDLKLFFNESTCFRC